MVEQIFLSSQGERSVILSNKLVYKSCLTSWRTTYDWGSYEISGKSQNFIELLPSDQSSSQSEDFVKIFWKPELELFP